jgi:tetratricopeptide (TPR) repeat protein
MMHGDCTSRRTWVKLRRVTLRAGNLRSPAGPAAEPPRLTGGAARRLRPLVLPALVALAVFLLALDHGGYGLETRGAAGVLVWWTLLVLVGLGVWPRARLPRAALVTGALLLAFGALTGASTFWAHSEEGAFIELGRIGLYLGVFAVTVVAATRVSAAAWSGGMATGIAAVAVLALADRCFSWQDTDELRTFLPGTETRLSYPLGYWNGMGALLGIGVGLLLRPSVDARLAPVRGLAVAALPALGAALYLTSSRGGAAVAAVGALTFVLLAGRAVPALLALAVGGAGTAAAIAILEARPELVDGPLESAAAASQGESAAPLLLLVCVVCGVAYALLSNSRAARVPFRRDLAWTVVIVALAVGVAGAVAADPAARFEDFKEPPNQQATDRRGFVSEHLLSGEGSGRWQFWSSAVDQFEEHPLAGGGAGSYGAWWLRNGSLAFYVEDAHSLYMETLGELGLLGLGLLLATFGSALAAAVRRLRDAAGELRPAIAAATAGLAAFMVGAAIDWSWELTLLAMLGIVCVGVLTGPATLAGTEAGRPAGLRRAARVAIALLAVGLIVAEAIPWMVDRQLRESREALAAGDGPAAETRALEARRIQPWAASPHLQLALVREHERDFEGARRAIARALELEPENWQLWVVAARLDAGAGNLRRARRELDRARELHPRSPLFPQEGVRPP